MKTKSLSLERYYSFGVGAPSIWSCAPKILNSAPKNLHLVAQVLPKPKINFEPCRARLVEGQFIVTQGLKLTKAF